MAHPYNTRFQSLKRKAIDNENENEDEHTETANSAAAESPAINEAPSYQAHRHPKRRLPFRDPYPEHLLNGYASPSNTYLVPPTIDDRSPASPSVQRLTRVLAYPGWLSMTNLAVSKWFWTIAGPINFYNSPSEHGNTLNDNDHLTQDAVRAVNHLEAESSKLDDNKKPKQRILSDLEDVSDSELFIPHDLAEGQIYRTRDVPSLANQQRMSHARNCDTTSCTSGSGESNSAYSDGEMILVDYPIEKPTRPKNEKRRHMPTEKQSQSLSNGASAESQVTRKTALPSGKTYRENQPPKKMSFIREGSAMIFNDDGNLNKGMYNVLFDPWSDTNFIARNVAIANGHKPQPLLLPDIRSFETIDTKFTPRYFVVMRLHIYIKGRIEPLEVKSVSLRVVDVGEDKIQILLGHKFIGEQEIYPILLRSPEPAPGRALAIFGRKPTKEEEARMEAVRKIDEEIARKLEAQKTAYIQARSDQARSIQAPSVQGISTRAHQPTQAQNSQHRVNSGSSSLASSSSSTNISPTGQSFSSSSSRTSFGESPTRSSNRANQTAKG